MILPNLLLGGEKAASNKERLIQLGVKNILNVTCQLENMHPNDFNYKRIVIDDSPTV